MKQNKTKQWGPKVILRLSVVCRMHVHVGRKILLGDLRGYVLDIHSTFVLRFACYIEVGSVSAAEHMVLIRKDS